MEDLFEGFPAEITSWESLVNSTDLNRRSERNVDHHKNDDWGVQLLSRHEVDVYGIMPKMEQKIYIKCKECKLVFHPHDVRRHRDCTRRQEGINLAQPNIKKKTKGKRQKVTSTSGSSSSSSSSSNSVFKKPLPPPPLPLSRSSDVKRALVSSSISPPKPSSTSKTSPIAEATVSSTTSPCGPSSPPSSKIPKTSVVTSTTSEASSSATTSTSKTTTSSSSSHSSRSSKSRKNNTKVDKEFDPNVHCGVVEGSKRPCTRSITCVTHRLQLKKLVGGRGKDVHQLIAERKAAKEKELKNASHAAGTSTEEHEIFCQNTSYVPIVATIVSTVESTAVAPTTTYVPIKPKTNIDMIKAATNSTSTSAADVTKLITSTDSVVIDTSKPMENWYSLQNNSQESAIGTVPVLYMPMSPISVVSPVQFVQIGKNMICLESPQSAMSSPLPNQSVFLTIPDHHSHDVKMYKTYPKPIAMPNFGARKVLSKLRVERQQNDILKVINARRETNNSAPQQQGYKAVSILNNNNNTPHRPNILKVKSLSKVDCKRAATDKIISNDSKQLRLTLDVNAFIFSADMSESADAPQPNDSIQEKLLCLT